MAIFINFCANPAGLAFQVHLLKTLRRPGARGVQRIGRGFLAASYFMAMRKRWPRLGLTMATGVAIMAMSFALMGMSSSIAEVHVSSPLRSGDSFIQVPMSTLYQEITPAEIRDASSRCGSRRTRSFLPYLHLSRAWLSDAGSRTVLLALAALLGVVSLAGFASQHLREHSVRRTD